MDGMTLGALGSEDAEGIRWWALPVYWRGRRIGRLRWHRNVRRMGTAYTTGPTVREFVAEGPIDAKINRDEIAAWALRTYEAELRGEIAASGWRP